MNDYEKRRTEQRRETETSMRAADRATAVYDQKQIEAGARPRFPLLFLVEAGNGFALPLDERDYDLLIDAGVSRRSHAVLAAATNILWSADDEEPRSLAQLIDPNNQQPGVDANASQRRAMSALLEAGRLKKVGAARSTAYLLEPYAVS